MGINPAWEASIADFKKLIVLPLFQNKETITEQDWNKIIDTFKAYTQWKSEEEGKLVESLGIERIHIILSSSYEEQLVALLDQDKDLEDEANNIILVDKLVRYHRDIFTLLK